MSSTAAGVKAENAPSDFSARKEKKIDGKAKKIALRILIAALITAAAATLGVYIGYSVFYSTHFFPNTKVNGIDVSGEEVLEVKQQIASEIEKYDLTVVTKEGNEEVIDGAEFGLAAVFGNELIDILETQNGFAWPEHLFRSEEKEIGTMVDYSSSKLADSLRKLQCMNPENVTAPEDAYLSDYVKGTGYSVIPEVEGNTIDYDKLVEAAEKSVPLLSERLDLSKEDVYVHPTVFSDDETLNARAAALNRYVNKTITYSMDDASVVLDGETISKWLTVSGKDNVVLNENAVRDYVTDLASQVDTFGEPHDFLTSSGAMVTIEPSYFGWKVNQEAEFTQLLKDLKGGADVNRQPIWEKEGKSFGTTDYGNTYVEVNLSAQHIYFYKDGVMVLDSPCVTGCVQKGTTTPAGVYTVFAMETSRYLVGENYRSFVNYWMPFNGGIGFHDATWRGSFGSSIYVTNGSHGCVNLPLSVAKELYSYMEVGMPVLVYHLESTATVSESSLASTCIGLINSANPVSLGSEDAIVRARNIYNYLSSDAKALVTNYDLLCAEEAELANQKANAAAAQAAAEAAAAQAAAQAAAEAAAAQAAAEAAAAAAAAAGAPM